MDSLHGSLVLANSAKAYKVMKKPAARNKTIISTFFFISFISNQIKRLIFIYFKGLLRNIARTTPSLVWGKKLQNKNSTLWSKLVLKTKTQFFVYFLLKIKKRTIFYLLVWRDYFSHLWSNWTVPWYHYSSQAWTRQDIELMEGDSFMASCMCSPIYLLWDRLMRSADESTTWKAASLDKKSQAAFMLAINLF